MARNVLADSRFEVADLGVWTEYTNDVFFGGANDARVVAVARAILGMPEET